MQKLQVKVTHSVDLETEYPHVFREGSASKWYYCEGTRGGVYKLIVYKNGDRRLYRAKDLQNIRHYEIIK